MTKKAPPKRTKSYGPRLPGAPTKKTQKARAKRKPVEVSAEDVLDVLEDVGLVGQQAVTQPVDVPVQTEPLFGPFHDDKLFNAWKQPLESSGQDWYMDPDIQGAPALSPKQERAKRRLELGQGWTCPGCSRVLSMTLSGCPYCSKRRVRA